MPFSGSKVGLREQPETKELIISDGPARLKVDFHYYGRFGVGRLWHIHPSEMYTPSTPKRRLQQLGLFIWWYSMRWAKSFEGRCTSTSQLFWPATIYQVSIKFDHTQLKLNSSSAFRAWLLGLDMLEARKRWRHHWLGSERCLTQEFWAVLTFHQRGLPQATLSAPSSTMETVSIHWKLRTFRPPFFMDCERQPQKLGRTSAPCRP